MSASCSIEPDSRRSDSFGICGLRDSTLRDSWERAMTGILSSRASCFNDREISEISVARFSPELFADFLNGCFHGLSYSKARKGQMNKENKYLKSQQNHKLIRKRNRA